MVEQEVAIDQPAVSARPSGRSCTRLAEVTRVESRLSAQWAALLTALVIALYLCWQMVQPFVNVLLWALVLTIVFLPVHRRILARLRTPSLSAAVSTALVVVTIVLPVTLITIAVIAELREVARGLEAHQGPWLDPASPVIGPVLRWLEPYVDLGQVQSATFVRERLQAWSGVLAAGTLGVVGGVASAAVQTLLVVFTLYYLFRDGEAIRHALYDIVPIERSQTQDIVTRTKGVVGASVYGVLVIAAIQGGLGFFIFWVLGLPSPLLWGVVMFFLSMIPMAGAFLVWAPAALYLAFTGAFTSAVILTVWGVLVVGSIDNFLSPRLVGKRTCMHELLIFFAVLGGLEVFGVIGVVLGPVVVAVTLALLEMVREANRPAEQTLREESLLERQERIRQAG
jgi:predicted PurR-regulated permease PerM